MHNDQATRKGTFEVRYNVMLVKCKKEKKLEDYWEGSTQVIAKLSHTNFEVRLSGSRKEVKTYHSNLMKPFHKREGIVLMSLNALEEAHLPVPRLSEHSGATEIDDTM